ncbi:MAG: hypothetical protein ACLP7O_17120 [Terracidiphilus sp.]
MKTGVLETVDHDRYVEGGANTEITSVILARLAKNIRTIKNILLFWVILFCLSVVLLALFWLTSRAIL